MNLVPKRKLPFDKSEVSILGDTIIKQVETSIPDLTPAHKDATTAVHGVGGSTVASAATLATHAALTTGVHGVGGGTVAKTADIPSAGAVGDIVASTYGGTAAAGATGKYGDAGHKHALSSTIAMGADPLIMSGSYLDAAGFPYMKFPQSADAPPNTEGIIAYNTVIHAPQFYAGATYGWQTTPIWRRSTDIDAPAEGDLYYNTTNHVIRVYNGTAWKTVTMA